MAAEVTPSFRKRKKFTVEITPEKRLSDRWEQQVFHLLKTYPHAKAQVSAIIREHTSKKTKQFIASEEAITAVSNLYSELKDQHQA